MIKPTCLAGLELGIEKGIEAKVKSKTENNPSSGLGQYVASLCTVSLYGLVLQLGSFSYVTSAVAFDR